MAAAYGMVGSTTPLSHFATNDDETLRPDAISISAASFSWLHFRLSRQRFNVVMPHALSRLTESVKDAMVQRKGGSMAAKLEWNDGELLLGGKYGWVLGAVRRHGRKYSAVMNRNDVETREEYEEYEDAAQDLESEVRRLLREAGVLLAD